MAPGRVLLVAGSDSSGGAGLEAGQKVLAAHGCYAMTATTALTVQNTTGVKSIHIIPSSFVEQQMEACLEDIGADVLTTGMLAAADTIEAIARQFVKHKTRALVVDPVMVSTSGAQLLPHEAIRGLSRHLPLTTVLTPNLPEAKLILAEANRSVSGPPSRGVIESVVDVEALGRRIRALGPQWVLVKGGHLPLRADMTVAATKAERGAVVDVLLGPDDYVLRVQSPWQESMSTHGTGCSLAAAISSGLAKGQDVPVAVRAACRYIDAGIREAPGLGSGCGPLGHFHSIQHLPFSPGYFVEYLLDRPDVKAVWETFVYHPFVMALGNGMLPLESFKGYIIQDYLYLVHFARANALAAYKAKNLDDINEANQIVVHILQELKLHADYCKSFGIPVSEMKATEEKQACTAYTRYFLDVGQSEDWLALQVALAPCLLGYSAVAQMLHTDPKTRREGNTYWPWIQNYVADGYVQAVELGSHGGRQGNAQVFTDVGVLVELLEGRMRLQSPGRIEELVRIFIHATKMEVGFWEMFPYE